MSWILLFITFKWLRNHAIELNDDRRLSQCHLNTGNILVYQDEFVRAFEYYLKCKDIAKRLGDRVLQCQVAMAMGDAYVYLGEVEASIGPFQEAFNLALQCNDKQLQMYSLVSWLRVILSRKIPKGSLSAFSLPIFSLCLVLVKS